MRAKKINEVQNFERGLDPKQAMDIGNIQEKKKLIAMMADPGTFPSGDERKAEYKSIIKVILDPNTQVKFMAKHEDISGDRRIVIVLPQHKLNVFFFESLFNNLSRNNDVESYHWDNPDFNMMNIYIN